VMSGPLVHSTKGFIILSEGKSGAPIKANVVLMHAISSVEVDSMG
jgi:hypothetical protein